MRSHKSKANTCANSSVAFTGTSRTLWIGLLLFATGQSVLANATPNNWWREMGLDFRELYTAASVARSGDREAMVIVGKMFMRGYGSREGAKPEAAYDYFRRAADKGDANAMLYVAVIDSMRREELASVNVASALERYRLALTSSTTKKYDPSANVATCADYLLLIHGYAGMMLQYPKNARQTGKEGGSKATIDFAKRTVIVEGGTAEFSAAITRVLEQSIEQIPEPEKFDRSTCRAVFPFNFKLTDY